MSTEPQTDVDEDQVRGNVMRGLQFERPALLLGVVWYALVLFYGSGVLFEVGMLLFLGRRFYSRMHLKFVTWGTGVDVLEIVTSSSARLPTTGMNASTSLNARIHRRLGRLCIGPFDLWMNKVTHLFDRHEAKLGAEYQPVSALPEFTLQGLITLSAAVSLIIPFSDGVILNDGLINTYLCICLVYMFARPILLSRHLVEHFLIARTEPLVAGLLAGFGYLAALFLVGLQFQPNTALVWKQETFWGFFEALGQTLAPSPLREWRMLIGEVWSQKSWADVDVMLPFIPEAFAVLVSIGALKIAGTVLFLKPTDVNFQDRGLLLLRSGRTRQARRAFDRIQDREHRFCCMLFPSVIDEDYADFEERVKDFGEEIFAPFWASQPEMTFTLVLHSMNRLYDLDVNRFPLVRHYALNGIHPALTFAGLVGIGGAEDPIAHKVSNLHFFAEIEAARDPPNNFNPKRFPVGLFNLDDEQQLYQLDLEPIEYVLKAAPSDDVPALDQLGTVIIMKSVLTSSDANEVLGEDIRNEFWEAVRQCASNLHDCELPLGREMEEVFIRDTLHGFAEELDLDLALIDTEEQLPRRADRILTRNIAKARSEGAAN